MSEQSEFDTERVVDYWLTEGAEAFQVAHHLVEKADYSYALFFGHLAVEKTLKALYAHRMHHHAPLTHNLCYVWLAWRTWIPVLCRRKRLLPSRLSTLRRVTQI